MVASSNQGHLDSGIAIREFPEIPVIRHPKNSRQEFPGFSKIQCLPRDVGYHSAKRGIAIACRLSL